MAPFCSAPTCLAALPLAVARRLVRRAMELVKGDLRGIDFGHIAAVLDLARSTEGHGRLQAPGLDIFRSFEWLRFGQPARRAVWKPAITACRWPCRGPCGCPAPISRFLWN